MRHWEGFADGDLQGWCKIVEIAALGAVVSCFQWMRAEGLKRKGATWNGNGKREGGEEET